MAWERTSNEPVLHQIGRYSLLHELAAGGMATVHVARFHGEAGFHRTVAVKRLHPHFAKDPDFVCMFLDEARLASRIRHPHVVSVLDVVAHHGELVLAMDYVHGVSLAQLQRLRGTTQIPLPIAVGIVVGVLSGLHAAHEAKSDRGDGLEIVHRDVSPQNVMIGDDGVARVVDFGIASASARLQTTAEGQVKGKLSYMAPEQIRGEALDRRVDLFAAGIILWELLTARRFADGSAETRLHFLLGGHFDRPSRHRAEVTSELDRVVMKALAPRPEDRFSSAEEMTKALLAASSSAHAFEIATWMRPLVGALLDERALVIREAESFTLEPVRKNRRAALPERETELEDSSIRIVARPDLGGPPPSVAPHEDRPFAPRRSKRTALVVLIALGAVFAAFAAGAAWFASGESEVARDGAPVRAPAGTAATDVATTRTPAVGPRPSETLPNLPGGEPKALEGTPLPAEPTSPPAPRTTTVATTGIRSTTPKRSPKPAADSCTPPYVLLPGGMKRYKPECL